MKLNKNIIVILLMLIIAPMHIYAGGKDSLRNAEQANLKALQKKLEASHDSLKKEKNNLERVYKNNKNDIKTLNKEIRDLKNNKEYKTYTALIAERDSLENTLKELQEGQEDANQKLSTERENLKAVQNEKTKLVEIQNKSGNEVRVEYSNYLEKPFSEMTIEELDFIQQECKRLKIKDLKKKAEKTKENKTNYDEAKAALDRPYDEGQIKELLKQLNGMENLSANQSNEIEVLVEQLNSYEKSNESFEKFLEDYNKVDHNNEIIHKAAIKVLRKKYFEEINKIPYLSGKIKEFGIE